MSTLGIAYHRKGTHPPALDPSADPLRATRLALRDAEYRVALGLEPGEKLPARLGMTYTSGGRKMRQASGGTRRAGRPAS